MAREGPFTCLKAWPRFRRPYWCCSRTGPPAIKSPTVQKHLASDAGAAGDYAGVKRKSSHTDGDPKVNELKVFWANEIWPRCENCPPRCAPPRLHSLR